MVSGNKVDVKHQKIACLHHLHIIHVILVLITPAEICVAVICVVRFCYRIFNGSGDICSIMVSDEQLHGF